VPSIDLVPSVVAKPDQMIATLI